MTRKIVRRLARGIESATLTGSAGLALALLAAAPARAQDTTLSPRIHVDQVGYFPDAPKIAVVVDSVARGFRVEEYPSGRAVYRGSLGQARHWDASNETVRRADFTAVRAPGRYVVRVDGVGRSYPFAIDAAAMREVARAAAKAFYFQRASTTLDARFAGRWSRAAGHPDTAVLVHPSAAGPGRPAGSVISAPGGWYDAGDYNKYIVNSGISTYTLLLLCEQFPAYVAALDTRIPESGNELPDVLDEALVNVRWMLRMQDPADGGVYHKLTNAVFDRFERPDQATAPRYVVQKSTAAALDFAAVAAHASLLARRFPRQLPGLADSLVAAAQRAWGWARANPAVLYDQKAMNERFTPAVLTGEYGDRRLDDEWAWAAAELTIATRSDSLLDLALPKATDTLTVPSWNSVRALGLYTLLDHREQLPARVDRGELARRLRAMVSPLVDRTRSSPYGVPIGGPHDWVWGSNAVAANQGMALVQAYRLTEDTSYLEAAVAAIDYLLGRNPTGYTFVTGIGSKAPMAPHHRPSASDTVVAPVPGLLVGGPNPGQQDNCGGYPSRLPALSYVDAQCNYAANEIAINWNAPLVYLAGALDALLGSAPTAPPRAPVSAPGALALTPPMGWNSWNKFACNVSEQLIRETADAIVRTGMRDAGYVYVNVDDCWHGERDSLGFIRPDSARFPSGMKALADYVHARGLKLGVYSDAGSKTCGGRPGSRGYERQDALTYARWGVDYLKYDWCNTEQLNAHGAYLTMHDALAATGRPIVLSICEWGSNEPWKWGPSVGQLWRTTGDIGASFASDVDHGDWKSLSVLSIVDRQVDLRQYAGPGHWNDPDMLEVGNGLTSAENRAHFSMWAMLAAPLIAGNDIRSMPSDVAAVLLDRDVIAVDQDSSGVEALRYAQRDSVDVWFKPLARGEWAMAVLNRATTPRHFSFDWSGEEVTDPLSGAATRFGAMRYTVRDLWAKRDLGTTARPLAAEIAPHDVLMLRLRDATKPAAR